MPPSRVARPPLIAALLLLASILLLGVLGLVAPTTEPPARAAAAVSNATPSGTSAARRETTPEPPGAERDPVAAAGLTPDAAMIRGRCVRARDGGPLAGLLVRHVSYPLSAPSTFVIHSDVTRGDGSFRVSIEAPEANSHELLLGGTDTGYCLRQGWLPKVGRGQQIDLGTIELEPGTEVHGRVVDEAGTAVAGADVLAPVENLLLPGSSSLASLVTARSDDDGRFTLGPLAPGEYRLAIGTAHVSVIDRQQLRIAAAPSAAVTATIRVRRLPILVLRVVDADGRPVPRAVARVLIDRQGQHQSGPVLHTDASGSAQCDAGLLAGQTSVAVVAWAPGHALQRTSVVITRTDPDAARAAATIALSRGESLVIRVRDSLTAAPVQAFTVAHAPVCDALPPQLLNAPPRSIEDPEGLCCIPGIGGDHRVTVSAVGYEPRQVVTGAAERRTGTLTVDLDPAADLVIEVDGLGGDLDGNVLQVVRPARGGDPLARTATVLSSAQIEGRRATARGVAAGIAYVRPVGTWCTPFAHGPLTLSPGERRCVVVRPARGCTLTGRIVPARGRTLVDGLRLLRADGRMTLPQPFGGARWFPIAAGGEFACTGVPAAEWHVEVAGRIGACAGVDPSAPRHVEHAWTRVATIPVNDESQLQRDIDISALLSTTVRGVVLDAPKGTVLRPIGTRSGVRWLGKPIPLAPDGTFAAELAPASYRWMLTDERSQASMPLPGAVDVAPGGQAVVTLSLPVLEEIKIEFANEIRNALRGPVWIRYDAATDLRARECMPDEQGGARVAVVPGESFVVETLAHGWLRPVRMTEGTSGPARYSVGR